MHKEQNFAEDIITRPHVVLLGAGASIAAFPKGDKNNKSLPSMENLVKILELDKILIKNGIPYKGENFEDIFSSLYEYQNHKNLVSELEKRIYNYFSSLQLPVVQPYMIT